MRPVSDAFLRTVRGGHKMVARATVCTTFQSGTAPVGTVIPIIAGSVTVDGTADIRSTLDLTTDGTRMWPTTTSSTLLLPYGNEVYVERGIYYGGDTAEYVGLGYFRIQQPDQQQPPNGPIRIAGRDRMAGLIDGRLLAPVQFLAGTTLGAIVDTLVFDVYPSATIEWDDATDTLTLSRSLLTESDRYGFLDDLISSVAKIWYWDHRGVLVIKSLPDPAVPVFDISSGAGGVLTAMKRQLARDGVYNAIVATGEAADSQPPARGVAYDNNPDSPTYFFGTFGPVPKFFSSPYMTTDAQCAAAAATMLQSNLGLAYSVDLSLVPNPALEPYDPVTCRAARTEPAETHVLSKLTVPLAAAGAMSATTRNQTVVLIGTA